MVLEAVREDRMPGGRNGSGIYNLYKLKYKKSRQTTSQNGMKAEPAGHNRLINPKDDSPRSHLHAPMSIKSEGEGETFPV
jgi:hypothetical protein